MTKLLSCHYNMDTNRVEARFEPSGKFQSYYRFAKNDV